MHLHAQVRVAARAQECAAALAEVVAAIPWLARGEGGLTRAPLPGLADLAGAGGGTLAVVVAVGDPRRRALVMRTDLGFRPAAQGHAILASTIELALPGGRAGSPRSIAATHLVRRAQDGLLERVRRRAGLERLDAVGTPSGRDAYLAIRHGATSTEEVLARSPHAPRGMLRALRDLERAGLVVREGGTELRAVAPAEPIDLHGARPLELAAAVVDVVARGLPGEADAHPDELRAIGRRFGERLAATAGARGAPAATVAEAAEALAATMGRLGHRARIEPAGGGVALLVDACPLRAALRHDRRADAIDQGMWEGLLAHAAPPPPARIIGCDPTRCRTSGGACRVVIQGPE